MPFMVVNGDLNDLRLYSEEQAQTQIEALVEQLGRGTGLGRWGTRGEPKRATPPTGIDPPARCRRHNSARRRPSSCCCRHGSLAGMLARRSGVDPAPVREMPSTWLSPAGRAALAHRPCRSPPGSAAVPFPMRRTRAPRSSATPAGPTTTFRASEHGDRCRRPGQQVIRLAAAVGGSASRSTASAPRAPARSSRRSPSGSASASASWSRGAERRSRSVRSAASAPSSRRPRCCRGSGGDRAARAGLCGVRVGRQRVLDTGRGEAPWSSRRRRRALPDTGRGPRGKLGTTTGAPLRPSGRAGRRAVRQRVRLMPDPAHGQEGARPCRRHG